MLTVILTTGEKVDFADGNWVRIDDNDEAVFGFIYYREAGDGNGRGELSRFQPKYVKRYILNGVRFDMERKKQRDRTVRDGKRR